MNNIRLTPRVYLKAARSLARKDPPNALLQKWWDHYSTAKTVFEQHGTLEGHLANNNLHTWLQSSRNRWNDGTLNAEQIKALQAIGLQRNTSFVGAPKKSGERLERTLDLSARFAEGTTLTSEERTELNENLAYFRSRYGQGQLSDKTAAKLGIA